MSGAVGSTAPLAAVLELARQACRAYDRADLADRLGSLEQRATGAGAHVVVVGEFKQGKSSLVNALVNAQVCPVDDDIATAVPTVLRDGPPGALVHVVPAEDPDGPLERRPISMEDLVRYATERGAPDPTVVVRGVEVSLERKLLAQGLVLVDTPGVGGLGSAHATATLGALSVADAALFVTDASQELTRTELDFLERAAELCPVVFGVVTKTDFYPSWRRVLDLDQGHLERAGLPVPLLAVSSSLRNEALRRNDKGLNVESGFPALVATLTRDVLTAAEDRHRARVQAELSGVCDQLRGQHEAQLEAAVDPARAVELTRRLEETRAYAEQLRSRTARWSTTLNDGIADLTSDIDFDFRQRMRGITQHADDAIAAADPIDIWAEFEPWLTNRVSYEVVANYRYLTDRALALSHEVATLFDLEGEELRERLDVSSPTAALARVQTQAEVDLKQQTAAAKGMTILRGSYTGVLMFTMLGSMVGVALGPVAVGIGLLMGRKGLKDEKERHLAARRAEARNAVRRYCDEVSFQVGKDSRDTLRRVQRQLRDHYAGRAEELQRATTAALKAATEAAKADHQERGRRADDARAELRRIDALRAQVAALAATPAEP